MSDPSSQRNEPSGHEPPEIPEPEQRLPVVMVEGPHPALLDPDQLLEHSMADADPNDQADFSIVEEISETRVLRPCNGAITGSTLRNQQRFCRYRPRP